MKALHLLDALATAAFVIGLLSLACVVCGLGGWVGPGSPAQTTQELT